MRKQRGHRVPSQPQERTWVFSGEDSPKPEQVTEGVTANEHRLLPWFCFDFIMGVVTVLFRTKRTLVLPECLYWTELQVYLLFSE